MGTLELVVNPNKPTIHLNIKNNNNKKKVHLKQYIQHLFQQALKHKIIQNNLQIQFKNKKSHSLLKYKNLLLYL